MSERPNLRAMTDGELLALAARCDGETLDFIMLEFARRTAYQPEIDADAEADVASGPTEADPLTSESLLTEQRHSDDSATLVPETPGK